MHDSLLEAIIQMRFEIGLEPFQIGDKVLCNLYLTDDLQFESTIHEISSLHKKKIYLIDCPISIGFSLQELNVKAKSIKALSNQLYYRWVEINTLKLLI
jgi:hypothetical protein